MTTVEAYQFCREIARREAKNFYYAFRVLPRHKSDAMCAVYAFMRKADDLADDEALSLTARREAMAEWLTAWRASRTADSDDPVFRALADTQHRFNIADALLEELVQGTAMDLEEVLPAPHARPGHAVALADGLLGYQTFDDLYRYCYLVASVVGLVCIHIFGYTDPAAELLAERTGIAFQLTNILRDVKEDAERKRIYLPQDMLRAHAITNHEVLNLSDGSLTVRDRDRALLADLSSRAWDYYAAAEKLLPLIDADSRPALWVLVEIYSRLLKRVDACRGDVFSTRSSVPTGEKLLILGRGTWRAFTAKSPAGSAPTGTQ